MAELNLQTALNAARHIPALSGSVTVVDDAGKVVTTTKTIFSAFKSAREAYKARKAEIQSERSGDATRRRMERHEDRQREARRLERRERKMLAASVEDGEDDDSQRKKDKKKKSRKHRSSSSEGRESEEGSPSRLTRQGSSETMLTESTVYSPGAMAMLQNNASLLTLAPAAMLAGGDPLADTLQMLLLQLQNTIDEMSCITAGIGALISELQKVPDTLAVVGLTLAEISAIVAKISPAAIMGMKSAFPVIFGLLGSPQFAVVAGVGMAATVVVLGGYKIIKNLAGAGPKDPDEEERDLDLEFGVTTLPDEIDEPEPVRAPASPPRMAIMPAPTQLENDMNRLNINSNEDKERRKAKRRDSENMVKAVKSEKSLKSVSSDKSEKSDKDRSHKDRPKLERGESSRRHDKGERREKSERRDKSEKRDKSDRHERGDRHEKSEKHERSDKHERSERSDKSDKKKKELVILPPPSKFSLIRRATAPASPMEPQRPVLSKRTPTALASSKLDEKVPKKKILGDLFGGRS